MEINDINEGLTALNKIEDARDVLRAAYDERDTKLRAAKEQVEVFIMQQMKEMGLQSFEVPGQGKATIKVKRRFGCADWGVFWNWMLENKCPEMMQKRLLDTALAKYVEDNAGLPPGVSSEAFNVVTVTGRPKGDS